MEDSHNGQPSQLVAKPVVVAHRRELDHVQILGHQMVGGIVKDQQKKQGSVIPQIAQVCYSLTFDSQDSFNRKLVKSCFRGLSTTIKDD